MNLTTPLTGPVLCAALLAGATGGATFPALAGPSEDAARAGALPLAATVAQAGPPVVEAPEWTVSEWIGGDPGSVASNRGNVILVHFFQLWCPGCNRFSIPLFQKWDALFGDRDDVTIVSIHTVFEGHSIQTSERLKDFIKENGITHPVGIDAYDVDPVHPVTMKRYRTGGTPHTAIVDRKGRLRFRRLGSFDPKPVEDLIRRLLDEPGPEADGAGGSDGVAGRADTPGSTEAAEADDAPGGGVSGQYSVTISQNSSSCAPEKGPLATSMSVEATKDSLRTTFERKFLGAGSLEAHLDEESGLFEGSLEGTVDLRGIEASVTLEYWGEIREEDGHPVIDFEFWFEKLASDSAWDCEIGGEGTARRIGP